MLPTGDVLPATVFVLPTIAVLFSMLHTGSGRLSACKSAPAVLPPVLSPVLFGVLLLTLTPQQPEE
jgi:ABC-type molybdate transport system permease subunit